MKRWSCLPPALMTSWASRSTCEEIFACLQAIRPHAEEVSAGSDRRAARLLRRARPGGGRRGAAAAAHGCRGQNFASIEEMREPAKNVDYAARFLRQLREREGSWTMAVARYHAGPNKDPAQRRYVCRLIANMVASGFSSWTAEARAFYAPNQDGLVLATDQAAAATP